MISKADTARQKVVFLKVCFAGLWRAAQSFQTRQLQTLIG
jgi:hypothetical protein